MEGVQFVLNSQNEKVAVMIDLKTLSEKQELLEDFLDAILVEAYKDEPSISWEAAKAELKVA